jgi:hypothetical protein
MFRFAFAFLATFWLGATAQAQGGMGMQRPGNMGGGFPAMGMNNQTWPLHSNGLGGAPTSGSSFGTGASSMMGAGAGFNPNFAATNGGYGGNYGGGWSNPFMQGGNGMAGSNNPFMQGGNGMAGSNNGFNMGQMNGMNNGNVPMNNNGNVDNNQNAANPAAMRATDLTNDTTPRTKAKSTKTKSKSKSKSKSKAKTKTTSESAKANTVSDETKSESAKTRPN